MSIITLNPLVDQPALVSLFGQTVDRFNMSQAELYMGLLEEEFEETCEAWENLFGQALEDDSVDFVVLPSGDHRTSFDKDWTPEPEALAEVIDGAVDVIVIAIGLLCSLGVNPQKAWDEVYRSNRSKVQPDGTVLYRADGKVQKPDTYSPPDLLPIAEEALEIGATP